MNYEAMIERLLQSTELLGTKAFEAAHRAVIVDGVQGVVAAFACLAVVALAAKGARIVYKRGKDEKDEEELDASACSLVVFVVVAVVACIGCLCGVAVAMDCLLATNWETIKLMMDTAL